MHPSAKISEIDMPERDREQDGLERAMPLSGQDILAQACRPQTAAMGPNELGEPRHVADKERWQEVRLVDDLVKPECFGAIEVRPFLAAARAPNRGRAAPSPPSSGGLPGGRVLSRRSPSTPSCMKRSCQRQTTGLALPERRITSKVPQPSAVARMILARHTCFCGELRSATIASSRWRSSGVTLTNIPALILRA
jgi:hypothetical protein